MSYRTSRLVRVVLRISMYAASVGTSASVLDGDWMLAFVVASVAGWCAVGEALLWALEQEEAS